MPHERESTADLIAHQDFAALERQARAAVREADTATLAGLRRAVLEELLRRWHERPLPRLGELATMLGRHCADPAAQRLRETTARKLPDDVFEAMLHDHDRLLDVDALLKAAARGTSDAIHFRVATLRTELADTPDPRITSALLRWLEAPPIRAIDSQPMWNDVFEILFTQGDPRTLTGYAALLEAQFPAGKTMQGWIASRLRTELARFEARDDIDTLADLAAPGAEGDQAAELDGLAAVVAALTGEELVARGGEVITVSLDALLRPSDTPLSSPWTDARSARPGALPVDGHEWDGVDTAEHGRVVVSDPDQLVVLDADDRLLWALHPGPHAEAGDIVAGYALSPSGRWLALLRGGLRLVVVDLDTGQARHVDVALPPPSMRLQHVYHARCLAWSADERVLYSAHVVWRRPPQDTAKPYLRYEHVVYLLETRFTADHTGVREQRVVLVHPRRDDVAMDLATMAHAMPRDAMGVLPAKLALSPDGRWLAARALDSGHGGPTFLLERGDDRWRVRQALRSEYHLAWSASRLACRRRSARNPRQHPAGFLDPETALFTPDEAADNALRSPQERLEALERGLPAPRVELLSVAAHADIVAVGVSPRSSAFEVRDTVGNEVLLRGSADDTLRALALSPDGELLAYAAKNSFLLREIAGGRPRRVKGHKDAIEALAFTEGGPLLVVSLAADGVMVWSDAGERVADLRHRTAPRQMALRACGRALATAEADRITLWDLSGSGHELATVELDHEPSALGWSADETALLWLHGADLWRWQLATDAAPQIACTHAAPLRALAQRAAVATCVVSDASGQILVVEPAGDGALALRPVLQAAVAADALAVDRHGRIVAGCGHRGLRGSLLVLEPDAATLEANPGTAGGSTPLAGAERARPQLPGLAVSRPDEPLDVIRQRALERTAQSPSRRSAAIKKARAALRNRSRRASGVEQFAAIADATLWEATLAEIDPMRIGTDPVLGTAYQRQAWLVALLARAPDDIELVDAWRRRLTTLDQVDPQLPLDWLRSPYVETITLDAGAPGGDLRGLPALRQVRVTTSHTTNATVDDIDALLASLVVDEGKMLALYLSTPRLTRSPRLIGTAFDTLDLRGGQTLSRLDGLDPVRELHLRVDGIEDLEQLATCTRLEHLELHDCDKLGSLRGLDGALAGGAPLRTLVLARLANLSGLSELAGATRLETLTLRKLAVGSLHALSGCTALRELTVHQCPVTTLDGLPGEVLERVAVTAPELTDASALAALGGTLRELSLQNCTALTSLEGLDDATSLRTLDLRGCVSLATLPRLERCTQLEHVALHGTGLTPDGVEPWLRERATWAEMPIW